MRILLAIQAAVFCFCLFWALAIEGIVFAIQGVNSCQNIPATLCVCVVFAATINSLGLLFGISLGPGHYVIQTAVSSSLPAVFLSGNLWPLQNFLVYMKAVSCLFPSTPGSVSMVRASQCGASIPEIFPWLLHLLALAALYLCLALLMAKWRGRVGA